MNPQSSRASIKYVEKNSESTSEQGQHSMASDLVNILLIDDRPDKLLVLETILAGIADNLVMAHSGKDALRYLLHQNFAVILIDVNMPGMDGFETAALIRQRRICEHTPIIFFTSYAENDTHVTRGYSLGAVDYIFTPVVPEILRAKIAVFVDLHRKKQELLEAQVELEARVKKRTSELARINEVLEAEITERKRAENDLAQRAAQLARSNAELEQFAYVASHDLREPLRMVISYVQLLEKKYKGRFDEQADKYINYVADGSTRMYKLIDNLLAYAKAGRTDEAKQQVDMARVVEEVCSNLKPIIEESKAQITVEQLPTVLGFRTPLVQLMQNLISNAVKFRGQEPLRILVQGREFPREWIVAICDNGEGYDPQFSSHLFKMFNRLHDHEKYPGSGIGLAISKKIVEHHGGRIWAQSEPGKGASFYFALPRSES